MQNFLGGGLEKGTIIKIAIAIFVVLLVILLIYFVVKSMQTSTVVVSNPYPLAPGSGLVTGTGPSTPDSISGTTSNGTGSEYKPTRTSTFEKSVDQQGGGDYKQIPGTTDTACMSQCINDPTCTSWAWALPTHSYEPVRNMCFLKNGTPNVVPDNYVNSGRIINS